MVNKFDTRQSKNRALLPQLTGATVEPQLDSILLQTDKEATPLYAMRASSTPNLVVNIGSNKITNTVTNRSRISAPFGGTYVAFTSGTVTFPASSGGTVTVSPGTNTTLTVSSGNFIKAAIQIDAAGDMTVVFGTQGASEAAATFPTLTVGTFCLGYVTIQNSGGTIQNITDAAIYQFSGSAQVGFQNPMTTAGDLIIGGASGTPGRLAAPTLGRLLVGQGVGVAPIWTDTITAPVVFSGITDQSHLLVSGHSTQTVPIFRVVNSAAANLLSVDFNGQLRAEYGSAALPTYSWNSDTNTGLYHTSNADQMALATNGVDRLIIDNSALTPTVQTRSPYGTATEPTYSFSSETAGARSGLWAEAAGLNLSNKGVQRMSFRGAQINIGAGQINSSDLGFPLLVSKSGSPTIGIQSTDVTGTATMITFYRGSFGSAGSITSDLLNLTTTYGTISDARRKENIQDFDALAMIDQMNPVEYTWKHAPDAPSEIGFIAQELNEVFPQAVIAPTIDPTDPNKIDCPMRNPWQVDYAKLTGVLVKAIQEQQELINELKARIEALES